MQYAPTALVLALAAKVKGTPIAHAIRTNGDVVIVFEDGRKLVFAREDLPTPASTAIPGDELEPADTAQTGDAEAAPAAATVEKSEPAGRARSRSRKKGA